MSFPVEHGISSQNSHDIQFLTGQPRPNSACLPWLPPCLLHLESGLLQLQPARLALQQPQRLQFEMPSHGHQPLQHLAGYVALY